MHAAETADVSMTMGLAEAGSAGRVESARQRVTNKSDVQAGLGGVMLLWTCVNFGKIGAQEACVVSNCPM